ncbi:hypothetical protein [Roseibium sp. M-1]
MVVVVSLVGLQRLLHLVADFRIRPGERSDKADIQLLIPKGGINPESGGHTAYQPDLQAAPARYSCAGKKDI